jgi:hypothetical protein
VIVCVSAAVELVTPYIVTSHHPSPVQGHLRKHGLCFGRTLILKSNQRPYINADIFLESIRTSHQPYFLRVRQLPAVAEELVVWLMENCSGHVADHVIRLLIEAKVRIIPFAPHTFQIFQVLHATLSGVLDSHARYDPLSWDDSAIAKFIMKLYHDSGQALVQPNTGEFSGILT